MCKETCKPNYSIVARYKGATWLADLFPSLHAGNFMCPAGFYHSSLVGHHASQLTIDQTVSYTILVTKIATSNPDFQKSLNLPSATFKKQKTKRNIFSKNSRKTSLPGCPICKESFDFLLVSCLWQLPRKKSKIVDSPMLHLDQPTRLGMRRERVS